MDILEIILMGIALAMDCFAVSTTQGLAQGRWHPRALLMAVLFGLFQGGMPLIGFLGGSLFSAFFSRYAHWIALILLLAIGGHMVVESFSDDEDGSEAVADWGIGRLLALAVATSIDALATGVIFIPIPSSIYVGVVVIALCSLAFSLLGYMLGVQVGKKLHFNAEIVGGLILIGLGVKIWIEGMFF